MTLNRDLILNQGSKRSTRAVERPERLARDEEFRWVSYFTSKKKATIIDLQDAEFMTEYLERRRAVHVREFEFASVIAGLLSALLVFSLSFVISEGSSWLSNTLAGLNMLGVIALLLMAGNLARRAVRVERFLDQIASTRTLLTKPQARVARRSR